ncbi:MAG: carboxypeptidase-like regulatory domain-containing protein [Leeuwenhoekiella sp.]
MRELLFLFLSFLPLLSFGQSEILRGQVKSVVDSSAVVAASVYFDGSTIGTITDANGYFSIENSAATTNALVITSLGYISLNLNPKSLENNKIKVYYLAESTEQLNAVLLEADPWSREKKIAEFKREFLGKTKNAEKCTILNEEVLRLRYSPSRQELTAEAIAPLVVMNKNLGYKLSYDLKEFSVLYEVSLSGFIYPIFIFYTGTTFYKPLKPKASKRIARERDKAFTGSLLHFMRSLANESLKENKFRIFREGYETPPYKYFAMEKKNDRTHVIFTEKEINILFENKEQSIFQTRSDFYIDAYGNHSPPDAVTTGGVMGEKRVADLVPIDYETDR